MNINETRGSIIRKEFNKQKLESEKQRKKVNACIERTDANDYLLWKEKERENEEISKLYVECLLSK